MGIGRATLKLLQEEGRRQPFHGTIGTLGKMSIGATPREISRLLETHVSQPLTDVELLQKLGFQSVESIDYCDFEGADHVTDLNDSIPQALHGRFDVVFDGGTLEHVFHLPNALRNAVNMTKVGGRVIISAPSSNYMDHGFYMFSPTLFMDYFLANNLKVEMFRIARHSLDASRPWRVYDYKQGDYSKFFIGCLNSGAYSIFAVATRSSESTADRIPQQSYYSDAWEAQTPRASRRFDVIKSVLKNIPYGLELAMRLRAMTARRGIRGLRYVGKY